MNVYKFGGSSLASAARIRAVAEIAKGITSGIIVLSAMGKATTTDEKITDLLIKLCKNKENCEKTVKKIKAKFIKAAYELQAPACFCCELNDFFDKITMFDNNYIVSRGEYFTAKLFSHFTQIPFVDSASIIKFDKNKVYSHCLTQKAISAANNGNLIITCGFYGSDPKGNIVLFPRGGGDTTAACLAKALGSDYLYDYTDVGGLKTIPPALSKKGCTVSKISINDLDYLAKNGTELFAKEGTKYFHKKTTLIILNSFKNDGKTIASKTFFSREKNLFTIKKDLILLKIIINKSNDYYQKICGIFNFLMSRKIRFVDFFKSKNEVFIALRKYDYIKFPEEKIKHLYITNATALHFLFSDDKRQANNVKTLTEKIQSLSINYRIHYNKQRNIVTAYIDDGAINKEKIKRLAEDFAGALSN